MSLADELLADLEDGDDYDDGMQGMRTKAPEDGQVVPMDVDAANLVSVRSLTKLCESKELERIIQEIDKRSAGEQIAQKSQIDGPVEAHPEYKLIVDANNLAQEIDNDINIVHKFVRDHYSHRFPELESLIPSALEYLMTVKELGNDLNKAKTSERLQEFLTQATIMVLSVTASTTQGQLLNEQQLSCINEACDIAIQLNSYKQRIYQFVESRMSFIAPNLSGNSLGRGRRLTYTHI